MAVIPYPGTTAARIKCKVAFARFKREGGENMTELELTIRSLQNRINESRNRGGLAVNVSLTTLSKALTLLKQKKAHEPFFTKLGGEPHRIYCGACNDCIIQLENELHMKYVVSTFKFCPKCGCPIKWPLYFFKDD